MRNALVSISAWLKHIECRSQRVPLLELLLQAGVARWASAAGYYLTLSGVQLDTLQPTGELPAAHACHFY